jgi:tRNA modification GTPase
VDASYGDGSPIAALATVPGTSALALIRVSGERSLELLAGVFSRPEKLRALAGYRIVHGWISGPGKPGAPIDEVLVSVYRAPRSYTGEDGADISCHGGPAVVRALLETLLRAGFREALPGEFSFRAFMNGKIDLTRSESVMELVAAKTGAAREHAVERLAGSLEREISAVKSLLVEALAAVELCLDYSGDEADTGGETAFPWCAPAGPALGPALDRLRALAASYHRERLYTEGALAVITGRPNAGKSSLFNRFLREDRSIVTGTPGTTRDWIEARLDLEGIPLRLADTAGLRDSEDPVEKIGISRSRELLAAADLILYLIDGTAGITAEDRAFLEAAATSDPGGPPLITVWNKADITPPPGSPPPGCIPLSALTGAGLEELCARMAVILKTGMDREDASGRGASVRGIGSARQKALVDRAVAALEEALAPANRNAASLDLIAPLLREAVNALGEITGEVSTAEILQTMFSRFCVGK